jgi:hypothetical protein
LHLTTDLEFQLRIHKIGPFSRKIVAELIKVSTNYKVLYENIQVIEDKTIGEIDFGYWKIKKHKAGNPWN